MDALVNFDAENTVLGCMLSDETCLHRALPLLSADDFSVDYNRRLYRAIADLAETGALVDELTLTNTLIERGQLESVGGVGYITDLSRKVDSGLARLTNVERYAEILLDKSLRRRTHSAANCLLAAIEDASVPTEACIAHVQEELLRIEAASAKTTVRHSREVLKDTLRELEVQANNQGLVGMSTGIHSLDLATGGIRPGELWTVGALPGRGKTALSVQIALTNGAAGVPTLIFSLEMQDVEIGKRFLAARSDVSAIRLRNPNRIQREAWAALAHAAADIAEFPVYVDGRGALKIQELLATSRLYVRRHGVCLVIVDYLRLVDAPGRDLRERIGHVANALRQLAKKERIGVVLLSQLRRPEGGINARPSMLELKESGDIEAHSHVVVLPHLPVSEVDGKPLADEQMLVVGKNRNGGVGSLPVRFDVNRLQFFDRERATIA